MDLRSDTLPPADAGKMSGKYVGIFRKAKPGDSVHLPEWKEAQSLKACFYQFRKRHTPGMKITIRKVGATDPEGSGYRVFFLETHIAA